MFIPVFREKSLHRVVVEGCNESYKCTEQCTLSDTLSSMIFMIFKVALGSLKKPTAESFRWRRRIHMLFRDTAMRLSGDFTAVLGGCVYC